MGLSATVDSVAAALTGTPDALSLAANIAAGAHSLAVTGLTGSSATNYAIDPASGRSLTFTITPKTITYSTGTVFGTYGDFASLTGSAGGITFNGVLAGDDVTGIGAVDPGTGLVAVNAHTPAGSYAYQALLSGASSANYVLASTGNTIGRLTLAQRHITASIADTQSTYGTLPAFTVTLNNIVAGDDVHGVATLLNAQGYATTFDNRLNVGQYRITADQTYSPATGFSTPLTGSAAGNYIFDSGNSATLTVVPKPISALLTGATYTYGSPTATIALSGIVAGDTITPSASLDGNATAITANGSGYDLGIKVAAGPHQINVTAISGARASNYTLVAVPDATVTITPRPLSWTIANATSTYGDLASPATTFGNLLSGDVVAATYLANGAALATRTGVGTYTTSVGGLTGTDAGNYMVATTGDQTGQLTITPRPVTYVVGQQSSTYGNLATPTVGFTNVVAGDTLSGVGPITVSQNNTPITLTDRTNAGTYQLAFTGSLGGADAANYTLTGGTAGTLTIAKRTISLTPDNISSVYGTLATPTGTFTGVLAGDQLTPQFALYEFGQASPITAGLDAYSYPIGGVGISGASAGNYQLDMVRTATLTVNPKPITVSLANQSVTYGAISGLASVPITLNGVLAADKSQVSANTSIILNGLDPNALLNAGTYTIAAGGLQGSKGFDYTYAPGSGTTATLTVNPVQIGTVGALSTIYGTLTNIGGVGFYSTSTGPLNPTGLTADRVLLSQGQAISYVTTTNVGTYQIGLANLLLNGQPTGNYVFDPTQTASLTIKQRTVYLSGTNTYAYGTVGSTAVVAPYDGTQFVAGDDVQAVMTLSGNLSSSGMANVGDHSGTVALTGSRASNYTLYPVYSTDIVITARPLTETFSGGLSRVYGDAGTITTGLSGLVTGDAVSVSSTANGGSTDINYARLTPATYQIFSALVGADAGNYYLTNSTSGHFTITQRPVWFDAAGLSQTYGSIGTPALDNVLSGDSVSATSTLLNLDGSTYSSPYGYAAPVGQYKLTGTLGGGSSGNYILQAPTGGSTFGFTIVPRTLNFSGSTSLTYIDAASDDALASLFGGVLNADIDRIAPVYTGLNGSATITLNGHPDAGTYTLAISSLGGVAGGNYVLGTNSAKLVVNPYTLQWQLGGSRVYGTSFASTRVATTASSDGTTLVLGTIGSAAGSLLNAPLVYAGDVQLGASIGGIAVSQGTDVGTYQLASPVLTGASAHNFQLAAAPQSAAPLTITPRTISYTTASSAIQYAGLNVTPTSSAMLNGVLAGDDVQPIVGFLQSGQAATQFGVGAYNVAVTSLSGAKALDYTVLQNSQVAYDGSRSQPGVLTINPRILTFSIPTSFSYGDTLSLTSLLTGTDKALVAQDGVSLIVDSKSAGGGYVNLSSLNVGSYPVQFLLSGGNYLFAGDGNATITINPRVVTYSIAPVTSIYGETPAFVTTLANALAGRDTPLIGLSTGTTTVALAQANQLDVGTYLAGVIGLAGETSSNYLFQPLSPNTGLTTIIPRAVTFNQTFHGVYGDDSAGSDQFSQKSGVTGIVNGDSLTATAALASGDITRLGVGTYSYDAITLGGAKLGDYSVTLTGDRLLTVTPRTLTYQLQPTGTYGDGSAVITLGNVLNGDSVQATIAGARQQSNDFKAVADFQGATSGVTTYLNPYDSSGLYRVQLTGLTGADAANYALPATGLLSYGISPRAITARQVITSAVYGTTFEPTVFDGILPNDNKALYVDPVYTSSSAAAAAFATGRTFGLDYYANPVRLDVGTYQFTVTGLTGFSSFNYTLAQPYTFTLSITQAPFTFALDVKNRAYGDQIQVCDANGNNCAMQVNTSAFYTRGTQRYSNDDVNATLSLTDASGIVYNYTPSGNTLTYYPGLNAGTYAISLTSLFGAQAKNYYIPSDYTKSLTIVPATIGYKIDPGAGYYFKGIGFVGAPHSTTLNGVYGSDQVSIITGAFAGSDAGSADPKLFYSDINLIPNGIDHLQAIGLVSSANYVLGKAGGTWGAGALITVDDAGFFNLGLASLNGLTNISYLPPPTLGIATGSGVGSGNAPNASLTTTTPNVSFTDLTSTSTTASTTPVSASVTASATTGYQVTTSLGNGVDSVSAVKANATVGASASVAGVSVSASAGFSSEERIVYGPGYSAIGVEGDASGSAGFSLLSLNPGLFAKGQASLDVYQLQGVTGSLGNGATGTLDAKFTEGAHAEGEVNYGLKDGTLSASFKGAAGTGVSAGIQGSISGASGSVGGGATVYSPGQVAAGFEPSVGYSDGSLNVGVSLTAALGIGGINLNFNFSINFDAIGDGIATAASAIGSALQGCDTACHSQERLSDDMKTLAALNPLTDSDKIIAMLTPGSGSAIGSRQDIDLLLGHSSLSPGSVGDYAGKLYGEGSGLLTAAITANEARQEIPQLQKQEQALIQKFVANPGGFTAADYAAMQQAKADFQTEMTKINTGLSGANIHLEVQGNTLVPAMGATAPTVNSQAAINAIKAGLPALQL